MSGNDSVLNLDQINTMARVELQGQTNYEEFTVHNKTCMKF